MLFKYIRSLPSVNISHSQQRHVPPMSVAPPGVLAPPFLEDDDLGVARLLLDGARDGRVLYGRPAHDRRGLGADEQDLVYYEIRADLDVELLRHNHVVLRHLVLRAAESHDGKAVTC